MHVPSIKEVLATLERCGDGCTSILRNEEAELIFEANFDAEVIVELAC